MKKWTRSNWYDLLFIPFILFVLTSYMVGINVSQHTKISPIDEYVYLDYTARVFEVGILPQGSQTGEVARNYISCLGVAGYGEFNPEACNSGNYTEKDKYPYSGKSSADIYPPIYFWIPAAIGYTLSSLADIDFLSAARLSGILWLSAASILLFLSLRKLNTSRIMSTAVSVMLIGSIPAWWSNTFISTDASALFAGSLALFGLVSYFQGRWKPWHLVLMSIILTLLKFQNIMVLGFIALVILISPLFTNDSVAKFRLKKNQFKESTFTSIAIVFSALFAQIVFLTIRKVMAIAPIAQQGVVGELTLGALLSETTKFISGITWGSSIIQDLPTTALIVALISSWIIIGGTVAATMSEPKFGFVSSMGMAWITVAMISAPLLGIAIQVMAGPYFSLPARYGLSLLPLGVGIAGIALDNKVFWKVLVSGFAVYSYIVISSGVIIQ